ncbi:MAG: hypothetical protein GY811_28295 [Myxococcales bacterium]|nr:hypothetical protein [Myxococcales bacterium]
MSIRPKDRFESMHDLLEGLGLGGPATRERDEIANPTRVDDITRDRIRELIIVECQGRLQLGLAIIEEIADRMEVFGDNALCAEFLLAAGRLYAGLERYDECDEYLQKCVMMAARANTPEVEAAAISRLIRMNRLGESDPNSAESMLMAGRSAVARAATDEQSARFNGALASLDHRRGRCVQALNPANHNSCFLLAQILWARTKEQQRALAIAEAVILEYKNSGNTKGAKMVADWYSEKTGKGTRDVVRENADT